MNDIPTYKEFWDELPKYMGNLAASEVCEYFHQWYLYKTTLFSLPYVFHAIEENYIMRKYTNVKQNQEHKY